MSAVWLFTVGVVQALKNSDAPSGGRGVGTTVAHVGGRARPSSATDKAAAQDESRDKGRRLPLRWLCLTSAPPSKRAGPDCPRTRQPAPHLHGRH